ncbi:MAG: hypothetical protein WKG00_29600 [Polyangiaceae bacterium]
MAPSTCTPARPEGGTVVRSAPSGASRFGARRQPATTHAAHAATSRPSTTCRITPGPDTGTASSSGAPARHHGDDGT